MAAQLRLMAGQLDRLADQILDHMNVSMSSNTTLYTNVKIIVSRYLLDFDTLQIIVNDIAKRPSQFLLVLSLSSFRCLFPFLPCLGENYRSLSL